MYAFACICSQTVVIYVDVLVRFKVRSDYRSVPVYVIFCFVVEIDYRRSVDLYYFFLKENCVCV